VGVGLNHSKMQLKDVPSHKAKVKTYGRLKNKTNIAFLLKIMV